MTRRRQTTSAAARTPPRDGLHRVRYAVSGHRGRSSLLPHLLWLCHRRSADFDSLPAEGTPEPSSESDYHACSSGGKH